VKTTIEVPDALFRQAKMDAARRGIPLRQLVEEALTEKLGRRSLPAQSPADRFEWPVPPPDVPANEIRRIQALIDEAFEQVDEEE
jgi:hypothetical protein